MIFGILRDAGVRREQLLTRNNFVRFRLMVNESVHFGLCQTFQHGSADKSRLTSIINVTVVLKLVTKPR